MSKPEKQIYLQKIGKINTDLLEDLKAGLDNKFKKFNLSIRIIDDRLPLLESEYNKMRKQYDGSKILPRLFKNSRDRQYFRTLGILDVDVYSSGLNFVFGIATPPHNELTRKFGVSLISITRLKEEFYDHQNNEVLFQERVLKEALHEIGHTFGLKHCENKCIMRFSNYLGETDQKPAEFCESCSKALTRFLNNIDF